MSTAEKVTQVNETEAVQPPAPIQLYRSEPLPAQRTFLDLQEEDETKPVFTTHHDLSPFCDDSSAKFSLACVSYSAEHKRLAATNGRTLITVPVEQDGIPDMLIDGKALHKALADAGGEGVQCLNEDGRVLLGRPQEFTRLAVQGEGKFPNVYAMPELHKCWVPDVMWSFDPAQLALLAAYAKKLKVQGITLAFKLPADQSIPMAIVGPVRVTLDALGDDVAASVVGIIMPRCVGEESEADGDESDPPASIITPDSEIETPEAPETPADKSAQPASQPIGQTARPDSPTCPLDATTRGYTPYSAGIDDKLCDTLADHGITTLGELWLAMQEGGTAWWKVKGIGRGTGQKVTEQFNEYLNQVCGGNG